MVKNTVDQLTMKTPEPASLALLGSALIGFGAFRRRRKAKAAETRIFSSHGIERRPQAPLLFDPPVTAIEPDLDILCKEYRQGSRRHGLTRVPIDPFFHGGDTSKEPGNRFARQAASNEDEARAMVAWASPQARPAGGRRLDGMYDDRPSAFCDCGKPLTRNRSGPRNAISTAIVCSKAGQDSGFSRSAKSSAARACVRSHRV